MRHIYLAAPWSRRRFARTVAQQIRKAGHVIVSRWHDEWADRDDKHVSDEEFQNEAAYDVYDVRHSDLMIVLNLVKSEGKAVEQGIALASGIPIIVVGDRSNVFHYLPEVTIVDSVDSVVAALAQL